MNYLKNKNNENLYTLIITKSNEFNSPLVKIATWESCIKSFNSLIEETDDSNWLIKQIQVKIDEKYHRAEATLLCNHRGWGSDFFKVIIIESAMEFD